MIVVGALVILFAAIIATATIAGLLADLFAGAQKHPEWHPSFYTMDAVTLLVCLLAAGASWRFLIQPAS